MKDTSDVKKKTCLLCASRCGMLLHTIDGRVTRIEGNPESPVSRGWCCSRGRVVMAEAFGQTEQVG